MRGSHTSYSEVDQFHEALPVQHDIGRLHIPMDNPVLVGKAETAADLQESGNDRRCFGLIGSLDDCVESLPVDEFHNDVGPCLVLPDIVDGDDVGMRKRAGHSGLLKESRDKLTTNLFRKFGDGSDLLDGDGALDRRVPGQVDPTLASPADFLQNDVAPDVSFFHGARESLPSREFGTILPISWFRVTPKVDLAIGICHPPAVN